MFGRRSAAMRRYIQFRRVDVQDTFRHLCRKQERGHRDSGQKSKNARRKESRDAVDALIDAMHIVKACVENEGDDEDASRRLTGP